MQLNQFFFKILSLEEGTEEITAVIELEANHLIYQGHFPGFPVTPAVIQIQIIEELLEKVLCTKLQLKRLQQAKFTTILNPLEGNKITVHISIRERTPQLKVDAKLTNVSKQFCRLNLEYTTVLA